MDSLTLASGSWVDIGNGTKMYDPELTQNNTTGTPVRPTREPTGHVTPPPSGRKQHSEFASQTSKASYLEYDHKLNAPDSKGHDLPQIVFRWLVKSRWEAERLLMGF